MNHQGSSRALPSPPMPFSGRLPVCSSVHRLRKRMSPRTESKKNTCILSDIGYRISNSEDLFASWGPRTWNCPSKEADIPRFRFWGTATCWLETASALNKDRIWRISFDHTGLLCLIAHAHAHLRAQHPNSLRSLIYFYIAFHHAPCLAGSKAIAIYTIIVFVEPLRFALIRKQT